MGALILAINPGNSHSPTLARLARELQGCELIGADSCGVAITAINKRVPDLVLLPDRTPRGETDLLARLRAVPGGVMTLKLPPVSAADPAALAKDIRTLLAEAAQPAPVRKPSGPSPHLVAAAKAMIAWMDARRAQWADAERAALAQEPVPAFASGGTFEPHERVERHEPSEREHHELRKPHEANEPSEPSEPLEPHEMFGPAEPRTSWLPRAAVAAGLAGAVAAGVWFWPRMNDTLNAAATETAAQPASAPADMVAPNATPEPLAASPETAPGSPDKPVAAPVDPAEQVSGFVAVFAPFDISVSNANQPVALDVQGRAMLPSGKYRLRFQNRGLGYDETRSVQIRPTETTTINLIPQTTISVTSNEPGEVLIDNQRAGETPFEGRAPYGAHTITVRTPSGERQFQIEATMKPVQLGADFTKP